MSESATEQADTAAAQPEPRGRVDPKDLRHLVVLGHPSPDSFNHAVAERYCATIEAIGQTAEVRDLYALGFDPLLKAFERPGVADYRVAPDVEAELDRARRAGVIVLVYPIWFGMPPAIITGYVDRVLGAGLTPRAIRDGVPHAPLAGKRLLLLTTSSASLPWLSSRGQWLGLREAFDTYIEEIFSFGSCDHAHFDAIVRPLSPRYADECLGRAADKAAEMASAVLHDAHRRNLTATLVGSQTDIPRATGRR